MKQCETYIAILLAAMLAVPAFGQVEKLSAQTQKAFLSKLPDLIGAAKSDVRMKDHLSRMKSVNAVRTALAVKDQALPGPFIYFSVHPTGNAQYLPDAFPYDGHALTPLRMILAKNEYEPCSFVVYPLQNLGKVQLTLSEFKTKDGIVFPVKDLDLKFIKVWYQNRNAWYSYFGDTGVKLVPELLVNDEEIIHVDPKTVSNYARSILPNGQIVYEWLGAPQKIDSRIAAHFRDEPTYLSMSPKFRDADSLQPVAMPEGQYKQFFLTAHAPANAREGIYRGNVLLRTHDGKEIGRIPVSLNVLPFELPRPKTYSDLNKEFLVLSYSYTHPLWFATFNGGDFKLAEKQYKSFMANKVRHNEDVLRMEGQPDDVMGQRYVELAKEAGMRSDYVLGEINSVPREPAAQRKHAKTLRKQYDELFGKNVTVLLAYGDENPASWFRENRDLFRNYQNEGFKFFIAGNHQTFYVAGYFWDFFNMSRPPEDGSQTAQWNQIGRAWTAWYAQQHVGVENPAHTRRQYGLTPWLSGYSALANYAHHLGPMNDCNPYNYKPMVFAYGTFNGELDTLSWEGFREGVDDIRYGTLLKSLALQAMKATDLDTRYAGGIALQYFAEFNLEKDDPAVSRLEMIRLILDLRKRLNIK